MTKEEIQKAEEFLRSIRQELAQYEHEYYRFTTAAKEMHEKWQQAEAARLAAETMLNQMRQLSEPKEVKVKKDFSKTQKQGKKNE